MDRSTAMSEGSAELAEAAKSMRQAAQIVDTGMFAVLMTKGQDSVTAARPVSINYAMAVTDVPAYMAIVEELWIPKAMNAFPGALKLGQVIANGETETTHFFSMTVSRSVAAFPASAN